MLINLSERVPLGNTGVLISRIVVGTSGEMGGFRRPPDLQGMIDAEIARIERFGPTITYDTANMYGAKLALTNLGNVIRELGFDVKVHVFYGQSQIEDQDRPARDLRHERSVEADVHGHSVLIYLHPHHINGLLRSGRSRGTIR